MYEAALGAAVERDADTGSVAVLRWTESPVGLVAPDDSRTRLSTVHRRALPGLTPEMERCFWERNARSDSLPGALRVGRRIAWVHDQSGRPNPHLAMFVLSRPAYSADASMALLYTVLECPLCGQAEYVLLRRGGAGWTVAERSMDWIS